MLPTPTVDLSLFDSTLKLIYISSKTQTIFSSLNTKQQKSVTLIISTQLVLVISPLQHKHFGTLMIEQIFPNMLHSKNLNIKHLKRQGNSRVVRLPSNKNRLGPHII